LKRERSDSHGNLEMVSQCIEFKPGAIDPALFQPDRLPKARTICRMMSPRQLSPEHISKLTGIPIPRTLPGGFKLCSSALVSSNPQTAHITYSDGLAVLSMFTSRETKPLDRKQGRDVQIGSIQALVASCGPYSSITWSHAKRQYTLVGNVGQGTLINTVNNLICK